MPRRLSLWGRDDRDLVSAALMARSELRRNVKPGLSNDPVDKLCACMNYTIGHLTSKDGSYEKAPLYFDACWVWHASLTDDQRDYVLYVIDNFTAFAEEQAKLCAARLPPAPRCPL
jgi:hypothetical protein